MNDTRERGRSMSVGVLRAGSLLALICLVGCSSGLSSAKSDFRSGKLSEAKVTLVELEPTSRTWPAKRRAEYALYRGLVHHALGDRRVAAVWLREAKALDDATPHTLTDDDRTRLELAIEGIGDVASPATAP